MTTVQCVPFSLSSVPKNGTKQTGRATRAHTETGHVPSRFPSRFAPECPVSGVPFSKAGLPNFPQRWRELLALDLSGFDRDKAALIAGLPLFKVAEAGKAVVMAQASHSFTHARAFGARP